MYRIDNATAAIAIPTPAVVGPKPNAFFTKGNPGGGTPATIVDDDWANAVQEEIANAIEGFGVTLDKTKRTQLRDILLGTTGGFRRRLLANTTFYVATTGSNANNGTAVGTPWLTLQFAADSIKKNYDLNGFIATIQLADGTYAGGTNISSPFIGSSGSYNSVVIAGNAGTPSNVVLTSAAAGGVITGENGAAFTVQNLKVSNTAAGTAGHGLYATTGAAIKQQGCVFGACSGSHQLADRGGAIQISGSYTVNGNAVNHICADANGTIGASIAGTCTASGTPTFSGAFAVGSRNGTIQVITFVFTGAATGLRYSALLNGVIDTTGGGASFFSGSIAGATATGGQYN